MNIGLLGGTFDPPHIAHMQAADVALHELSLDAVWFLPTGDPPHKDLSNYIRATVRCEMVRAAIAGNQNYDVCPYEVDNPGPHYTVFTLAALSKQFPEAEFTFIVGSDSVAQFHTWKDAGRLFELAQIAIFERPDVPVSSLDPFICSRSVILPVLPLPISSTLVRDRIKAQLPVKWLIPEAVENTIIRHGLYRT